MFKGILKKATAGLICLSSMTSMVVSAIPLAMSVGTGSYDTLGTQTALGSPLLNSTNFSTENWNEWETLCWGVFLSNFCQPLVDTYESAFHEDATYGSMGYGFNALWGGSGNDASNASIISALCEYAIDHQTAINEQVYVSYTAIDGTASYTQPFDNTITDSDVREATFRDLWFYGNDDKYGEEDYSNDQYTYFKYVDIGFGTETAEIDSEEMANEYDDITTVDKANIPTFYVKRDDHYIKILDYTDWWDCQIMSWISNAVRHDDKSIADQFTANFKAMWAEDSPLTFDSFGNILTNQGDKAYMTVPASINQNITGEPVINTLNSWIMNHYVNTYSAEQVALGLRQNLDTTHTLFDGEDDQQEESIDGGVYNGLPAIGESNIGNIGLFYYDLDSLYEYEYLEKGEEGNYIFGDKLLKLMSQVIDNDKTSLDMPLKFEIAGNDAVKGGAGFLWMNNDTESTDIGSVLTNTAFASNTLPNMNFTVQSRTAGEKTSKFQKTMLHSILKPSGERVNLFPNASDAIMIPVKAKLSSINKEKDKPTNQGALRLFYNYIYNRYQNTTNHTETNRDNITQYLQGVTAEKFFDECEDFLVSAFIKNYDTYDYSSLDKWWNGNALIEYDGLLGLDWDYGNNETINATDAGKASNTTRCIVAYPPSPVMQSVSSVLGIKDGAEFSTFCTYIYMTYLDFYGIQGSETLANGVQNNSKFDSQLFNSDQRKAVLIQDIAKELYEYEDDFTANIDIEEANLQLGYLMLSPEDGREYRKQVIDGTISDFIYEQYNKVVYGGASKYSGSASKSKSGFFYVPAYSENPITSFFLKYYADIATVAILAGLLVVLIFGLLKKRRFTWFIISGVVVINTFLLVPSVGDVVPYVTSKVVNNMFNSSMTFWSISEGITNATLEDDAFNQQKTFENMTNDEANLVLDLVSELSVVQTDGSLAVKQDISQKITQLVTEGVYSDIESYQSARWILPMVMQQFSANDNENKTSFIYKPLANIWTDLSNMYWYYAPIDAEITDGVSHTLTSNQSGDLPCANYVNVEEALKAIQKNNTTTNTADESNTTEENSSTNGEEEEVANDFNDDIITEEDLAQIEKNQSSHAQVYDKFQLYENLKEYYPDVINVIDRYDGTVIKLDSAEVESSEDTQHVNYRCYSYSNKDPARQVHLISTYLSDGIRVPVSRKEVFGEKGEGYQNVESWQKYIDYAKSKITNEISWATDFKSTDSSYKGFEFTADAYKRDDRGTMSSDLPYLWSTEQPIYYFYGVVKDTFNYDDSLGKLVYHLQGTTTQGGDITKPSGSSSEIMNLLNSLDDDDIVRNNFMYATITQGNEASIDEEEDRTACIPTGKVRDVLDLEEMFTNTIPYLYQMHLTANGFNGTDGILGSNKITKESTYYEGELQSWMYRCNWATKIMENPSFSQPTTVKDANGTTYTVNNPLLAECYPANRPMVVSEAQEYALGLEDKDLNIFELKCCELNKKVARSWTLLLNYAGTPGITREILLRQMATDATLLFAQEFSSTGIVDTKYELYPSSIDLRYTSFDSIMKQLMLNVSRDTSFIYGDTMLTVISHSDMFTAVLLLIATYLCAMIAPLGRVILLASVFYLGFLGILRSLVYSSGTKLKMACGQLVTNLLFMGYTLAYFFVFKLLMSITTSDQVLNVDRMSSELGSPTWLVIVIILISIIYLVLLAKHIKFCYENYSDMGYTAYSQMATSIVGSIKDTAGRISNNFTNLFSEHDANSAKDVSVSTTTIGSTSNNSSKSNTSKDTDTKNTDSTNNGDSKTVQTDSSNSGSTSKLNNTSGDNTDTGTGYANYEFDLDDFGDFGMSANDINNIINQGASIGNSTGDSGNSAGNSNGADSGDSRNSTGDSGADSGDGTFNPYA